VLDKALPSLLAALPEGDRGRIKASVKASIQRERGYQRRVVDLLEARFTTKQPFDPPENEAVFLYLAGELHRRLGEFDLARARFAEAEEAKPPGVIADFIKERQAMLPAY